MKKVYTRPNITVTAFVTMNRTNEETGLDIKSQITPNINNDSSSDWTIHNLNK